MDTSPITKPLMFRALALGLVLVFGVFLTQAVSHSHANSENAGTCHVCKMASFNLATAGGFLLVLAPFSSTDYISSFVVVIPQTLFCLDCPSRAPPCSY